MTVTLGQGLALQEALFWMNVNLELLAVEHRALRRMRKHLQPQPGRPEGVELDVELLVIEVERVMARLRHWEAVVERVRSGRR